MYIGDSYVSEFYKKVDVFVLAFCMIEYPIRTFAFMVTFRGSGSMA